MRDECADMRRQGIGLSGKAVSTPYEGVVLGNGLTLPGGSAAIRGGGFFSTGSASGGVEMTVP